MSWPFLLDRLGTTVDRILDEAVQHYLDHFNLNHPADLVNALRVSGLSATGPKVLEGGRGAAVEALMKRRHWIVHQLDRNAVSGPGHFVAQSISLPTAQTFRHTAVEIGEIILADAAELP